MEPNLDLLRSNLQEIYSYLGNQTNKPKLVPNLSGTRVYDPTAGYGRLWRWFYAFMDVFGDGCFNIRNDCLAKALGKTLEIFREKQAFIEVEFKRYESNLVKLTRQENVDILEHEKTKEAIKTWHNATILFLRLAQNKQSEVANLFALATARQVVDEEQPAVPPPAVIPNDYAQNVARYRSIIDLEKISDQIPIHVLAKICRMQQEEKSKEQITPEDTNALDDWFGRISLKKDNDLTDEACGRIFHDGITAIVHKLFPQPNLSPIFVARVEQTLWAMQPSDTKVCGTLLAGDPSHLIWRSSLQENSVVKCNETLVTLGARLGEKPITHDKVATYSVKGNDNVIALIATNARELAFHKLQLEESSRCVRIDELDNGGLVMLVEKLKPLASRVWSTLDALLEEEVKIHSEIVQALRNWLKNTKEMPVLSPDHWGYNAEGMLKSMRAFLSKDFNFSDYEDFIFAISNKNHKRFILLMEESGLSKSPVAQFYNSVIFDALNADVPKEESLLEIEIKRIYGMQELKDGDQSKIIRRALALSQNASALKKSCVEQVMERAAQDPELSKFDKTKLKETVKTKIQDQLIKECQRGSSKILTWEDKIKAQVVNLDINSLKVKTPSSSLFSFFS